MLSFIDLREAPVMPAVPLAVPGGLPLQGHPVDLGGGPVALFQGKLAGGSGRVTDCPANLFLMVTAGTLTILFEGGVLALTKDRAAVLPQGSSWQWQAEGDVTLLLQSYVAEAPPASQPMLVETDAPLSPSGSPSAALLTTPAPRCEARDIYETVDEAWSVGVWAATPYARRHLDYGFHELMHILAGAVTITDSVGRSRCFAAGSLFIVPHGARCAWDNAEDIRKVYVIYRPVSGT